MAFPAIQEPLSVHAVVAAPVEEISRRLNTTDDGLSRAEAKERLARHGPNAIRTHHVSAWAVLLRQLNNTVLILLAATAALAYFLGDHTQALIIGVILAASIGLGFFNEYRAEQAAAALHSRIRHTVIARRDWSFIDVDVRDLVPGDVIRGCTPVDPLAWGQALLAASMASYLSAVAPDLLLQVSESIRRRMLGAEQAE